MGSSERIRTHVEGFDEKLGGGIPPGHIVIIAGEAGTMKSTVAWNILYQGAVKDKRSGAYITLEQSRDSFASHLRSMGLDPNDVEDRVSIVDLAMIRKNLEGMGESTWLEIFKMYAGNLKKTLNYEILVVDSLTVLHGLARFDHPREQIFQMFEWLRDLKATTFLISEMRKSDEFGTHGEEFLADGIIHVKMERVDDAKIERRIRCVKMRGTPHSPNYYALVFEKGYLQATHVTAA